MVNCEDRKLSDLRCRFVRGTRPGMSQVIDFRKEFPGALFALVLLSDVVHFFPPALLAREIDVNIQRRPGGHVLVAVLALHHAVDFFVGLSLIEW